MALTHEINLTLSSFPDSVDVAEQKVSVSAAFSSQAFSGLCEQERSSTLTAHIQKIKCELTFTFLQKEKKMRPTTTLSLVGS